MRAAIESVRNIQMPDPGKSIAARIADSTGRTVKSDRGPSSVSGHGSRKGDIIHSIDGAYIINVGPCLTLIGRSRDHGGRAIERCEKVNNPVVINTNSWIVKRCRISNKSILNLTNCPRNSVVGRDYDR
jgi:hypothetical protein